MTTKGFVTTGFVTTYRVDGKTHVYFYPGRDENGHIQSKFYFAEKNIDYLYTKHSDGAIDYIINNAPNGIAYQITDMKTGETKEIRL